MDDIFQSDQALLAALRGKKNIDAAIRHIYRKYYECLSIYVRKNSGGEQDAEDVFQEVVVTFIELVILNKFRGASGIKTFLYSLNRHIWLNELKKRGAVQQRDLNIEQAGEQVDADVIEYIAGRETKAQIMQVIEQSGDAGSQVPVNSDITPDTLIRYLDNELEPDERLYVETQLPADSALRAELNRLQLAKQAVTQYGRRQQVAGIHHEMMHELQQPKRGKLHWMRAGIRMAAMLTRFLKR